MAKVTLDMTNNYIPVTGLAPGQIGKVVANGGTLHNDKYVMGLDTLLRANNMFAVNLESGNVVTNASSLVEPYDLASTELKIRALVYPAAAGSLAASHDDDPRNGGKS